MYFYYKWYVSFSKQTITKTVAKKSIRVLPENDIWKQDILQAIVYARETFMSRKEEVIQSVEEQKGGVVLRRRTVRVC